MIFCRRVSVEACQEIHKFDLVLGFYSVWHWSLCTFLGSECLRWAMCRAGEKKKKKNASRNVHPPSSCLSSVFCSEKHFRVKRDMSANVITSPWQCNLLSLSFIRHWPLYIDCIRLQPGFKGIRIWVILCHTGNVYLLQSSLPVNVFS